MGTLTEPITLAGRHAPARVLFGPHETNLGVGRTFSSEHVAYYERRARGGAGVLVTEVASVHPHDQPYERAPLAAECGPGWAAVVAACRPHGTLVLAGLGHAGLQGSSAWTQAPLWAPSRVADPAVRELPMELGDDEIDAVIEGFRAAAAVAVAADVDGIELDAGPTALLRQFLSGLTNRRTDRYGADRSLLLRRVVAAVRAELGPGRILALRLSCDEEAPWAGITPEHAAAHARDLAPDLDLLTVVRGGLYAPGAYRPDAHTPAGFNAGLCRAVRDAVAGAVPVVLHADRLRVAGVAVSAITAVAVSFLGSGAVVGTPISEVAGGALSADATAVAPGGPAFSIWSVIYLGLLALAVWQALPAHHADPRQRTLGRWIAASMLLNAAWILVVQLELLAVSVAVIAALLAVLVRIFLGLTRTAPSSRLEGVVVDGTMFLYLGWVAVATVANTAAALRAAEVDPFALGADTWAVLVLVVVAAVSVLLAVAGHGRLAVATAMAWGLVWIAVARSGYTGFTSTPAAVAAGGAAAVALLSAVGVRLRTETARRRRP